MSDDGQVGGDGVVGGARSVDDSGGAAEVGRVVRGRAVAAWLVLLGVCVVLGGLVGAVAAVVVAALVLAQVPRRWIGIVGVGALVLVPLVVLAGGLPSAGEVSPRFVSRTLVPHHLTFVGLVLVSTWAVLELAPHLVRGTGSDASSSSSSSSSSARAAGEPSGGAPGSAQVVAAVLLVGAVAVAAFVAVQAVWQA